MDLSSSLSFISVWHSWLYLLSFYVRNNYLCTSASYLLTYLLTYSLTPWSIALLEKLTGFQPVKKFPAIYTTRMFVTAFISARYLSLSWASSIQSIPSHFILMLQLICSKRDNEQWKTTNNYFLRFWASLTWTHKALSYTSYGPISAGKIRPIVIYH